MAERARQGLTRGCIYREGIDHVHHHRLEGEYHAAADEREALHAQRRRVSNMWTLTCSERATHNVGDDPVRVFLCTPPCYEKPDRYHDRSREGSCCGRGLMSLSAAAAEDGQITHAVGILARQHRRCAP